jgi:REP element-mobilizing transposase RayT
MPRLPRLHVPGGFYHVILRGNHREDLFATREDRSVLNEIVAESIAQCEARVHAPDELRTPSKNLRLSAVAGRACATSV